MLPYFPSHGSILDVGCGDGLLAVLLSSRGNAELQVVGIDHSDHKIKVANSTELENTEFSVSDLSDLPTGRYDCVSLIDVLYCVPLAHWPSFLEQCTRVLRVGGLLLVKEVVDQPRWKNWFTYLEEFLSIKVFRMTKGSNPHFEPLETYKRQIEMSGSAVYEVKRLDSGRPYAHCLFLAHKQ